jgi:hypothetical protein
MAEKKPEDKEVKASPLRFSLNNIQVVGANIDFMDGPKHTRHTVRDAALTVPFISNLPYYLDSYVQPAFSAAVNGHLVAFKGKTKPFVDSLETSIDLNVKDLDLPYYLAYSPVPLKFRLVSGFLDTLSSVSYVQYKDKNPTLSLNGRASFKQIKITDTADAPLVSFPRIDINIGSSDLMAMNVHFARIDVQSPEINVVLDKDGRPNLLALMPGQSGKREGEEKNSGKSESPEVQSPEKKPLPIIETDEMLLAGGKVIFTDASEGRNFKTSLEDIQAKISHFSTIKDKKTDAEFSFRTDTQEAFRLTSSFSVDPLAAEGTIDISKVLLKKYAPYYRERLLFTVEDGALDVRTRYQYRKAGDQHDAGVSELQAAVTSLRLRKIDETEDFLKIPVISVQGLSANLVKKEMNIGDISSRNGFILGKRYRIGTLLFGTLMKVSEEVSPATGVGRPQKGIADPEKPWAVTVNKLLLEKYTIRFDDRAPEDPVIFTMGDVLFRGENISTVKNAKGRIALAMKIEKKGTVSAGGTVTIDPTSANLKLVTRNIPILPVQSYITDRVNVYIMDGTLSSSGSLSFSQSKDKIPRVAYKGSITVNNISTIDKYNAEDLLKWDSLSLDDIDFRSDPLNASIQEVALTDFYSRIIVNPDASLNLQNIMKTGQKAEGKAQAGEEKAVDAGEDKAVMPALADKEAGPKNGTTPKKITIERVTLQGGMINFSDNYIKPNFTTNMLEIGGRVTGLSSEETKMADIELRGKLENYAPLEITGRINPLRDDLFIDLKISFKDMDLSPLTPYSGRYLGYTIEKGKLTLNLQYLIEKKKLDAQNKILLNQFTLGSQVDSPDATKLPVRLAIALLKNRRGEIDLDVPVSGQIDDPEFSIFRIVLKILVNLLVKAATSPFALLGALFGGGEELSYVEFDPGLHQINEQGIKKLDTLLKALNDRPSLKLDIEGHADPETDREGLKQYLFSRKVKAQKMKDLAKKGGETVSVDDIKIEPAEYPKYLKAAYKEEKFPKPRNFIGMAKDLPVPEMEKLMLTHIVVKDDDLGQLASQRALAVKDHILKSKQVEPERIFLIEPKTVQPEKKEKVKDSRVDFKLK